MIKNHDDFTIYFPDFKEDELPEREYLIAVISTLNTEATKAIISEAREKRSISMTENEGNLVKVTREFREEFRNWSQHKSKFATHSTTRHLNYAYFFRHSNQRSFKLFAQSKGEAEKDKSKESDIWIKSWSTQKHENQWKR